MNTFFMNKLPKELQDRIITQSNLLTITPDKVYDELIKHTKGFDNVTYNDLIISLNKTINTHVYYIWKDIIVHTKYKNNSIIRLLTISKCANYYLPQLFVSMKPISQEEYKMFLKCAKDPITKNDIKLLLTRHI